MIALADVAVVVSSANASAKWWTENLGFESYNLGGTGHAILVAPPGERFVLHLCEGYAPLEPGDTGIAFVTDDLDALATKMTRGGVSFPVPPRKEKWGTMAKFADPDGNIFWLMEVPTQFVQATLNSRAHSRGALPKKTRTRVQGKSNSSKIGGIASSGGDAVNSKRAVQGSNPRHR